MKTLHIQVTDKVATYQMRDGAIICGNDDYQVEFTFDAEWNEHTEKTARFIWNGQYFDQEFTGTTCPVPVLNNTDSVVVGVYVGESADDAILSTTRERIPCVRSIRCGNAAASNGTGENYTNEARGYAEEAKRYAEALENAAGLEWKPLEKKHMEYEKYDDTLFETEYIDYSYIDPTPLLNAEDGIYLVRGEMWGMVELYFAEIYNGTIAIIPAVSANGNTVVSFEISHKGEEIYEPEYVVIDQWVMIPSGGIGCDTSGDASWSYAKCW